MHKATYIASYKSRVIRECSRAKNNYENRKLNDEALADEIQSLLSHDGKGDIWLDTKELCIIISTLINLNVNRAIKAKIFREWQIKARANIKSFIPQNIANTLTAISKLKIEGNINFNQVELKELLEGLMGRASANIKSFNSQEIANTLTAISKLKVEGNVNFDQAELKELLDGLIREAIATIKSFIPQNIANTLTAISKLKIEGNINFNQVELEKLLEELMGRAHVTLEEFKPQETANTLTAISKLKIEGNVNFIQAKLKALLNGLIRKASANIKSFIPQNIANTLTAISKLKIEGNINFNQVELKELLEGLMGRASANIKSFNSQEIANTLTAISKLKIEGNVDFNQEEIEKLLDGLIREAIATIKSFIPQNIANTLTAISKLKIEGNINFDQVELKALLDKLIKRASEKIEGFNSQEITNTLLALINLEFEQEEIKGLMSQLIEEAFKNIESFTAQDTANFLWALSVLKQDFTNTPQFKQKIIAKLSKFEAKDFTIEEKTQLFQALTYYNMPDILEKLKISAELIKQKSVPPSSSTLHKLVEKNLKNIINNNNINDYNIENEFFLPKISSYIDMKLRYKEKDYYIEVDGPSHFNSRGEYTARDLFHNKLFTQTYPTDIMIRLPYSLLEIQTTQRSTYYDEQKIETFLREMLENIEKLDVETGVFIASQEGLEKITEISAEKILDKKMPEPKIGLGQGCGLRSQEMLEKKVRPDEVKWPTPLPLKNKTNNLYSKAEVEAKNRPGALTDPRVTRSCGRGRGGYKCG